MSLDDYLRRFAAHRRITLFGPLEIEMSPAEKTEQTDEQTTEDPAPRDLTEPLIWVDGGAKYRRGTLGFAVGDGDSSACTLDQYLAVDKDYSDLAYVLRNLPSHFRDVILLGFLGARRDHELFNFGEVHHFLAAAKHPTQARFAQHIYVYSPGEWTFTLHGIFSLAVLETTTVQLFGACKFPLPKPTKLKPLTSLGLSNQGFGSMTLITQAPTFVFKAPYNTR